MRKTAILLMLLTVLSTMVGFVREIVLSYYYGVSSITDVYIISLTIPQTIFAFVGAGIATIYIPMYSNIEKDINTSAADDFTSKIINYLLILSTLIVIFSFIFATPIVKLFASGFQGDILNLAVTFTRISIFGIFFSGIIFILSAYLQSKNSFIASGLMNIPLNLVIIISIILSTKLKIIYLSVGSTIAVAIQMVFLLPFVYQKRFKYSFKFDIRDKYFKKTFKLSLPVIFSISVYQINELVNRTIASEIVVGGITSLTYASRLSAFIFAMFAVPIATAMYPMISRMVAENNLSELKKTISNAIISVNLVVLPATVGSMIFSNEIVALLFGRGAFNFKAISMTSEALFFFSIGMIGFALREILYRVFYSFQDTKTPLINASIAILINIILNIILSKFMGIAGLALATSISAIFATTFLFISFRKRIGAFGMRDILISFMKILGASLLVGSLSKLLYECIHTVMITSISFFITIIVGFVTYSVLIYFMKIGDVDIILNIIRSKLRRNKT